MTEATEGALGASPPDTAAARPPAVRINKDATDTFSGRYAEAVDKVNAFLEQIDWPQLRAVSLTVGLVLVAAFVLLITKGLLDTISLVPLVPGLLQLLGLVVVSRWALQNLSTSEKRQALLQRLESLRKEYLG